jgi:hypothetical protein
MPTYEPTAQPSAQPTSQPTLVDIIDVNALDTPITAKVVEIKVKFYLLTFAAYFLACFIILMFVDFSRIGKSAAKRLHASAYASNTHVPNESFLELHEEEVASKVDRDNKSRKNVFYKLRKKDYKISKLQLEEAKFRTLSAVCSSISSNKATISLKLIQSNRLAAKSDGYSEGFYAYIDQRRTYLGCEALFYPDGRVSYLCLPSVTLERSVMEDFLLFLCNNHSVLNCVFACDGSPVDRTGNRLIYITQNCIAFFLSAISGSVFNFVGLTNSMNIVFDLIVVTPATIAIAKLMKLFYTCPIGFSVEYQVANPCVVLMVKWLGKLAVLPIVSLIVALLVLAAIFTRGRHTGIIVINFFVQVQLYGFFLELVLTMLMFMSTFYMRSTIDLSFTSIVLFEVGRRYTELIYINKLVEGKDYHYRCYYLFCFLRIECIYRFDDAIKKGLVKEEDRIQDDVEMTVSSALHQRRVSSGAATRATMDGNMIPMIAAMVDDEEDNHNCEDVSLSYGTSYETHEEAHVEDVYVGYDASYDSCKGELYSTNVADIIHISGSNATSNPMIQSLNRINDASNMAVDEVEREPNAALASKSASNYKIDRGDAYLVNNADEEWTPARRKTFKNGNFLSLFTNASVLLTLQYRRHQRQLR